MDKSSVIKALQIALADSLEVIAFLKKGRKDPKLDHAVEQITQALRYSEHVYDEHPINNLGNSNVSN